MFRKNSTWFISWRISSCKTCYFCSFKKTRFSNAV